VLVPAILANVIQVSYIKRASKTRDSDPVETFDTFIASSCSANHNYDDPGKFDTGVIGDITAAGLVCNDGEDECTATPATHTCKVRIKTRIKYLTMSFQANRSHLQKHCWIIWMRLYKWI